MTVPAWATFFPEAYWGHFLAMVSADLRSRRVGHTIDGEAGGVRLDDGRVLGLANLAQMCHAASWDRWPSLIAHHFGVALRVTAQEDGDAGAIARDFDRARALCKPRLWHRAAMPEGAFVTWDVADDLVAVLTLDLPEMLATVQQDDAARWPIGRADLWNLALTNLRAEGRFPAHTSDVGGGATVTVLDGARSYFAASHALFLEDYVGAPRGGALVIVPRRHTVAFHRIEDARVHAALGALLGAVPRMWHEGPASISPSLYWWRPRSGLLRLPARLAGKEVDFSPPRAFLQMLERLPPPT